MKCPNCENGQVDIGDGSEAVLVACLDCNGFKTPGLERLGFSATVDRTPLASSLIFNPVKPQTKDRAIVAMLLGIFALFSFLTLLILGGCGRQSVAQSTPTAVPFVASDGATCYAIMQDGRAVGGNCVQR